MYFLFIFLFLWIYDFRFVGMHGSKTPLHIDIMGTVAFNYLFAGDGEKVWIFFNIEDVQPQVFRRDMHQKYITLENLNKLDIQYKIIVQKIGQVVLVPPLVPHAVVNQVMILLFSYLIFFFIERDYMLRCFRLYVYRMFKVCFSIRKYLLKIKNQAHNLWNQKNCDKFRVRQWIHCPVQKFYQKRGISYRTRWRNKIK